MSKSNVPPLLLSVMITIILVFILMYLFFPTAYTIPPIGYNRLNYVSPVSVSPVYPSYVLQTRGPRRVRRGRRDRSMYL